MRLVEAEESFSRAARRIHVHADILKAAKIIAGDVLALTSSDEQGEERVSDYMLTSGLPSSIIDAGL